MSLIHLCPLNFWPTAVFELKKCIFELNFDWNFEYSTKFLIRWKNYAKKYVPEPRCDNNWSNRAPSAPGPPGGRFSSLLAGMWSSKWCRAWLAWRSKHQCRWCDFFRRRARRRTCWRTQLGSLDGRWNFCSGVRSTDVAPRHILRGGGVRSPAGSPWSSLHGGACWGSRTSASWSAGGPLPRPLRLQICLKFDDFMMIHLIFWLNMIFWSKIFKSKWFLMQFYSQKWFKKWSYQDFRWPPWHACWPSSIFRCRSGSSSGEHRWSVRSERCWSSLLCSFLAKIFE